LPPALSAPAACNWPRARPVQQLPGFADGSCSVQDAAAQMAAPLLLDGLLPAKPGAAPLRVLDACAAPGGKTAHLLEMASPEAVDVIALEVDAVRSRRIDETLARLGLKAKVVVADAARPADWWDGTPFDAHPARRAVHRLGHRAPASRCPLAAPRERHRPACGPAGLHCWPRSGRWCGPAAGSFTAPAPSSAKRDRNKLMRFLYTTPTHDCCHHPVICCLKAGRMPVASRTIPLVITTAFLRPA